MKKYLFLLGLSLIISFAIYGQNINFQRLGKAEGLSQVSVLSIYQDNIGYLWFGTEEGLNRFDGTEIKVFQVEENSPSGLPSNIVNAIQGDGKGHLYLLSGYQTLVSYSLSTNEFVAMVDGCNTIAASKNALWYAKGNKIVRYDYDTKQHLDYYLLPKAYTVTTIAEMTNGVLYVGTDRGIIVIDANKREQRLISNVHISTIYEDTRKNIWVGTLEQGVYLISRDGQMSHFLDKKRGDAISSNIIRSFCEDNYGQIWIGSFSGLDVYIPERSVIRNYNQYSNNPLDLSHNSVHALYKDMQGTVWVGTYFGGVNYFNPETNFFNYYYPQKNTANALNFPIVGKMAEDKRGDLWICTEGGGLNFLNRKTKQFAHYNKSNSNLPENNLKSIWYNKNNDKLYIGTHLGGLSIFDIQRKSFKNLNSKNQPYLLNDVIVDIHPYKDGLIVLTQKGLSFLDFGTETIKPFFDDKKLSDLMTVNITSVFVDRENMLWCESNVGLKRINLNNKEYRLYQHGFDNVGTIGRHMVTKIFQSSKNELFFASKGSGLFKYIRDKDVFLRYSSKADGLLSDFIYDIAETSYGYLILHTNKGINLFDTENKKNIIIDKNRGLPLEMINYGCGVYCTSDSEIFAGGMNGMVSFFEKQISIPDKPYNLFFSELYIDNKLIEPNSPKSVLDQNLAFVERLRLKHWQNNIYIKFATSNFVKSSQKQFEYKLEGVDKTWVKSTDQRIRYSNLNPGKYELRVREHGVENANAREIKLLIHIMAPFYATWLAYLLYFLLSIFLFWRIVVFYKSRLKLKTSLAYEIRENDRIKELNQAKLQFFTNVSHEFRTPLTLIIGHVEAMLHSGNVSQSISNKLQKINNNALHLRNLITELLDFRKQERGLMQLKVSNRDFVSFSRSIFETFNDMASSKKINYSFECAEKQIMLWFDAPQMQKVLFNLLSNAFKYTPEKGNVRLRIERKADFVRLMVIDNGIGIPASDLERIFERFYQSNNHDDYASASFSTGVGLALSKGIVDLHKARIKANNNADKGATFELELLLGNAHFDAADIQAETTSFVPTEFMTINANDAVELSKELPETKNASILIVEDNDEMRHFLAEIFASLYNVETAADGAEALELLHHMQPDIILSDVMMPKVDGKELCVRLKSNFETCHIPFVLLTAETSVENNIEGLTLGADDYITKPFNVKVLISKCNNMVQNRRRLQERFLKQTEDAPVTLATNKLDQDMLQKATDIVTAHIDDSNFDVTKFASEMALGRSKLYIKLKGITGMTPNDFIQNIRLKAAANMLKNDLDLNVSDITYRLGFNTPRYFSKCFKDLFGMSPMRYRRQFNPHSEEVIDDDIDD